MIFASEPWERVADEFDALGRLNFEEAGIGHGKVEYGLDHDMLASLGNLVHVTTARIDGELVGYVLALTVPRHIQYDAKVSQVLGMYIMPNHRKGLNGYNLMKAYEENMRLEGVERIDGGFTVSKDLLTLFKRGGWKPAEVIYTKWLI